MKILIIGNGSFAKALAHLFEKNEITLFARKNKVYKSNFPKNKFDFIVFAIPSQALPEFFLKFKKKLQDMENSFFVFTSKGMIEKNKETISSFLKKKYSKIYKKSCFFMGPNLASEIISNHQCMSWVACEDKKYYNILKLAFNENIQIFYTKNVEGLVFLSVLKNIYAIGYGALASKESHNLLSLYLIKTLEEVSKILKDKKIKTNLVYNYFLSDFFASTIGSGRNKMYGYNLIMNKRTKFLVEGEHSLKLIGNNKYTILNAIYSLVFKKKKIESLIKTL